MCAKMPLRIADEHMISSAYYTARLVRHRCHSRSAFFSLISWRKVSKSPTITTPQRNAIMTAEATLGKEYCLFEKVGHGYASLFNPSDYCSPM